MQGYWIPYNTVTGEVGPSVNERDLVTKWLRAVVDEDGVEPSVLAVQVYTITDDPLAPGITRRVSDISYDDWMATKAPPEEPPADEADDAAPESPADSEVPV